MPTAQVLTPFLLGVVFQVGAILGVLAVTSGLVAEGKLPDGDAKNSFVRNVDVSQSVPAGGGLIASAFVVPGIAGLDRGIAVALAVVITFSLYVWVARTRPNRYGETLRNFYVTPLNCIVIAVNVVFGALAVALTR